MDIQTVIVIALAVGSAFYLIRKYVKSAKGIGGCGCGCDGGCSGGPDSKKKSCCSDAGNGASK